MAANLYEVLALGMRYWFTLLGVVIVLRSLLWLRKDSKRQQRRLRRLPDSGMVGELVVVSGSRDLPEGAVIALPWEGVLGYNRTCDVVVPCAGVAAHHLDFSFEERVGLLLHPRHGCTCTVDDELLTPRTRARRYPVQHGSTLVVGEAVLRLRVFEGIDVPHYARAVENDPPPGEQAAPWQPMPGPCMPSYGAPAPFQTPDGTLPPPPPAPLYGQPWQQAPWPPPQSAPEQLPPPPPYVPDYGQSGYLPPDTEAPAGTDDAMTPARPRLRRRGRRDEDE